ncbi:MAG: hypothetical protein ACLRWP_18565 [Bilophila wadsworthia]
MGDPRRRAVCPGLVLAPNTLIGLAVVGTAGCCRHRLLGIRRYDERQRPCRHHCGACRGSGFADRPASRAGGRTAVSITNGSGKTVTGVRFNVGATVKAGAPTSPRGTGSTTITSSIHGGRCRPAGRPRPDPRSRRGQGGLEGQHHQAGVR